jgi:hypothetical protein
MMLTFPTDIEIATSVTPRPIVDVARDLGLGADDLELYGKFKAKLPLAVAAQPPRGRLVLVTAINPTPAGEGKSTVAVGLSQALRRLGVNAVLCMREPSLGPVFGVKGGAAGGGYSQVVPMADINLHFTGDFHAISSAHGLLSALLDNHLHQGNTLGIDTRRITWPRTIDMNDRALRHAVIGLGGASNGVAREERWVIIPASEIMAIVALATGREDLQERLGRIIVGSTHAKAPVRARDLKAAGAMAMLLKDALSPNLVQTLEGRSRDRARRARSATSRTAATAFSRRGPAWRWRRRRHRGGFGIGPRRREVLRHQVPRRRAQPRSRGPGRDGPFAEDAGRRRRARERGRPSPRSSGDCRTSSTTSRTCASSAFRSSSPSIAS